MKKNIAYYNLFSLFVHFLTMVISLIIIILVLSITHERMALRIIANMHTELVQYTLMTAKQIREMLAASTYQNFYNPQVTKLRTRKDISNFDQINAIRVLNTFASSNNFIDSVYVYNGEKDYIYSTKETGSSPAHIFSDVQAVTLFKNKKDNDSFLVFRDDIYSFVISEVAPYTGVENAMMVNLDAEAFNRLYCQPFTDSCLLYRSETDTVVFSKKTLDTGLPPAVSEHIQKAAAKTGYVITQSKADKKVFLYAFLTDVQAYYIRCIAYDDLYNELKNFRAIAWLITLITFAAWIVISVIMMLRIYSPLQKIINSLMTESDKKEKAAAIDTWIQKELAHKKAYNTAVKNEFLKHVLVSPPPDGYEIKDVFKKYGISLDAEKPVYIVLVDGNLQPADDRVYSDENLLFDNLHVHYIQFNQASQTVSAFIDSLDTADVRFLGCSKKIADWNTVCSKFALLQELHALRIFYPGQKVFFEDFLDSHKKEQDYPDELETRLLKALKSGQQEEAKSIYGKIIDVLKSYRYAALIFGLKKLYLFLKTCYHDMTALDEYRLCANQADYNIKCIEDAKSIEEIHTMFYKLIDDICKIGKETQFLRQQNISEKIKYIIQTNYTDILLSSKSIAKTLNFSNTYISKIFKSVEGQSIADYINFVRMEHAITLLKKTKLSVKEIAKKTGIVNSQYFFVLFKKHSGQTPAEFRKKYT
ncbi:AraC family transcriptional regulator [Treponema sp. HNW]|uniref:helix-turn-helix domain-containing protein n=1 Tax=Treponema sp. HNW TaxID=3116654 RepID=UPI003D12F939